MTRPRKIRSASLLTILLLLACFASPALAQVPRPPSFLAEHYDLAATLDPAGQSISAVVKIDFKAQEVSGGVRVELHPNLDVKDVRSADGKSLSFERDSQNPLFGTVTLPTPVATGARV